MSHIAGPRVHDPPTVMLAWVAHLRAQRHGMMPLVAASDH